MWTSRGHNMPDLGLRWNDSQEPILWLCPSVLFRSDHQSKCWPLSNILMPPEIFKSSSWHGTKQHGAQLFLGLSFENVKHKEMLVVIILKWWISVGLYFNGSHCVSLVKNVLYICWLKLFRHGHVHFIVSKWERLEMEMEPRSEMKDKIRIKKSFLIFIWLALWPVSVLIISWKCNYYNIDLMLLVHSILHMSMESQSSGQFTAISNLKNTSPSQKYFTKWVVNCSSQEEIGSAQCWSNDLRNIFRCDSISFLYQATLF